MKLTSNYALNKPEATDIVNIDDLNANFDSLDTEIKKVSDKANLIQTAGGTATAITLNNVTLVNGFTISFVIASNNNGAATTINGKALYKPGGTTPPTLTSGKAATVWYNGTNFFIKASTEGDSGVADVLAGKKFSNDNDTGLTGTMTNNGATTITPGTTNQTIPAGYHNGSGYVVGDADLISTNIKSGANIFGVSGNANVVDTSSGDAVAGDILSGKKAYVDGSLLTGSIASKAAATYTPSTINQTIAAGQYLSGAQTISGDADLVVGNIKTGVNIFGVEGTFTSDATAIATQMYSGATAYVNGSKITGTATPRIPNLVINGNFANGTNHWFTSAVTGYSVASNVSTFTATSQYGGIRQSSFTLTAGHVYYVRAEVDGAASVFLQVIANNSASDNGTVYCTPTTGYETLSAQFTCSTAPTQPYLVNVVDGATSGWGVVKVRNVMLLDLTAYFGAGKEPTEAQMDSIIATVGWWDSDLTTLTIDATAVSGNILTGKTAYVGGQIVTGTMPDRSGADSAALAVDQGSHNIFLRPAAGYWDGIRLTSSYDANFDAGNILTGKTIFGLAGSAPRQQTGTVQCGSARYNTLTPGWTVNKVIYYSWGTGGNTDSQGHTYGAVIWYDRSVNATTVYCMSYSWCDGTGAWTTSASGSYQYHFNSKALVAETTWVDTSVCLPNMSEYGCMIMTNSLYTSYWMQYVLVG